MTTTNKFFGIVEGFFSNPIPVWTNEERIKTLNFILEYAPKINSYFYCPKDDYFVTKGWNKLYPEGKIEEISAFIRLCEDNNISYIYGFNPVISKNTVQFAVNKIRQLQSAGCKNFCLLFDDLPIAYDVIDNNYQDKLVNYSKLLVKTINEINNMVKYSINNFWVCSPDYCFKQKTLLTENLKFLNSNISLFWSGNEVFSKSVSQKDLQRVRKLLGDDRKIILWSNYPVNDCEQNIGIYNFGGFNPLNSFMVNNLSGIFVNPMREPFASLPFYVTFSDFLTNNDNYSRDASWQRAINLMSNDKKSRALFEKYLTTIRNNIKNKSEIKRLIFSSKRITYTRFCDMDLFPTNPNVARYYPEIVNIVLKRLSLLPKAYPPKVKTEWFTKKYFGRNKLLITLNDEKNVLLVINSLITFEQKKFIRMLNNKSINPKIRSYIFKSRQKIDRFTTDRTYKIMLGKAKNIWTKN